MNMITGYLASSEGEILVDGINVLEEPLLAKKKSDTCRRNRRCIRI